MVGHTPRVTVLMAVHNGSADLKRSVSSILDQTFKDFEFVIVDDGSDDDTWSHLESFKDRRLRLLRQRRRQGLTSSLIHGLTLATGDYVARQDVDDYSCPQRLERQVRFLDDHRNVALLGTGVRIVDAERHVLSTHVYPVDHVGLVKVMMRLLSPFPHSSVTYRRAAVVACGGYRAIFRKAQDYDLYLRLSERQLLANLPEPLCEVRELDNSVTVNIADGEQLEYGVLALASALARRRSGRDPVETAEEAFVGSFRAWYRASQYPARFRSRLLRRSARAAWAKREFVKVGWFLMCATAVDPLWMLERVQGRRLRSDADVVERWLETSKRW